MHKTKTRDAVLQIVQKHPKGITSNQVAEELAVTYDIALEPSTINTQLSRLETEDLICSSIGNLKPEKGRRGNPTRRFYFPK